MLYDNMNISHLMVYARRVEKERHKSKSRDAKRERSFYGGSSINRLEIQDKPRFRNEFQIKSLLSSKRLGVIGYLILNSRAKKVLIHQMISLHMTSVENVIFASAW